MKKDQRKVNKPRREQPRKDSRGKRVNYDNTRVDKFDRDIEFEKKMKSPRTSGSNDVKWYAHNPELLKAAASLPFSVTTGQPTPFGLIPIGATEQIGSIPGVLAMEWVPSLGGEASDAINQAARSTYSFLVHANSRTSTKYTDQDLMLVILAAGHLFSMIAHAIRMYGTMKTFDQRNDYLPKGLINAMGFNYEDCRQHLSQIWFDLNEIIARTQQIWIPNTFPVVNRWWWMNSNIYVDADSVKAQYYMFIPEYFGMYDETYNDQGGALNFIMSVPDSSDPTKSSFFHNITVQGGYTWQRYMDFLNFAISVLVDSEDRGMMMGDILKAYGAEKIFAIQPIPVDYRIQPVYDREVLSQIENCVPVDVYPAAFIQDQGTMRIKTQWYYGTGARNQYLPPYQVLNFHQPDVPTPEQIMVATRMKPAGNVIVRQSNGTFSGVYPAFTGTEYATKCILSVMGNADHIPLMFDVKVNGGFTYNTNRATSGGQNSMFIWAWSTFDWAPWIYLQDGYNNTPPTTGAEIAADFTGLKYVEAMGDYDNYTYLESQTLRKMHTTAVYSEFGVPTI